MTYPPQQPSHSGTTPPAKSRTGLIIGVVVAVVVALGGVAAWLLWPAEQTAGTAVGGSTKATPRTTDALPSAATCSYSRMPEDPAAKDVGQPTNGKAQSSGTVQVTLKTDQGDIALALDRAKAPCTVQSFLFLVGKKYFDGTPCHRITTAAEFKVLQCGDPTGTGRGGPGYKFGDELPKDLQRIDAERVTYPTGTVAMANAGPGTNGSQFFLVYGNTPLPPNYSVFGAYSAPAQAVIDKVAAGGVSAGPDSLGPEDGKPNTPINIQQATTAG
ncbi:peptidyl-prolyl cis-trans isomerase B (cyclophilin B) [Kibdelosporangium banguiense]|uniref:Peptidyl-prolyl cis-trans isomerase n=1 Tax=Kibdelosporangium banguiense TaxID=1365924 RepID=A0ABS4U140_9PSEU|nr:peptidylprolyl isomerase [Kibdelosporangium banguiense]MBP2330359.1 peptidyl-prolyl cis-trans isomerase B (cyclophilin B) [Kibdelosporangium banguiense]